MAHAPTAAPRTGVVARTADVHRCVSRRRPAGYLRPVTLRLRVDSLRWNAHVDDVAAFFVPLVPVVKGNGYGFGRTVLAERAVALADRCHRVGDVPVLAVGTVHELTGLPPSWRPARVTPGAPGGGPGRSVSPPGQP